MSWVYAPQCGAADGAAAAPGAGGAADGATTTAFAHFQARGRHTGTEAPPRYEHATLYAKRRRHVLSLGKKPRILSHRSESVWTVSAVVCVSVAVVGAGTSAVNRGKKRFLSHTRCTSCVRHSFARSRAVSILRNPQAEI
eukprot:1185043-Prorocentrum_minimum.AAC.1